MHIAANKAGIHATLPGYEPSGFAMAGPIQHSAGKVTVNFHSNSDSRFYSISQSVSSLSNTQLDQLFSSNSQTQTYQQQGKTIYIYANSTATWLNNGILYKVQGNAGLSSSQILHLATSF